MWGDYWLRVETIQAAQYNPPEEPLEGLVFDNGANQKLVWIADRVPAYVGPGDWIIDIPGGYAVMKDADFRKKYVPRTGEWPE